MIDGECTPIDEKEPTKSGDSDSYKRRRYDSPERRGDEHSSETRRYEQHSPEYRRYEYRPERRQRLQLDRSVDDRFDREWRPREQHHQDSGRGFKKPFDPWRKPDRWNDYTCIGKVIPEARIIAFKTPLKAEFFGQDAEPFEVKHLLEKVEELGGELGLVVDLTYTTRYYDSSDLTDNHVDYKKIFCPGRDFAGMERVGTEFVGTLKAFFEENKDNEKWVGVHCTHGLNRTGYLVCRYLHEALGWSIEDAIQKFQDARGHDIEREEYLSELRKLHIDA